MRTFDNYLITGGAGFIGVNFIHHFFEQHTTGQIINIDTLTYAGNTDNLTAISNHPNYIFHQTDICDYQIVQHIFETYNIDCVIHFVAESHVDRSIENPRNFINTNIIGTYNILDNATRYWKDALEDKMFYHVSTDEVYGSLTETGYFLKIHHIIHKAHMQHQKQVLIILYDHTPIPMSFLLSFLTVQIIMDLCSTKKN